VSVQNTGIYGSGINCIVHQILQFDARPEKQKFFSPPFCCLIESRSQPLTEPCDFLVCSDLYNIIRDQPFQKKMTDSGLVPYKNKHMNILFPQRFLHIHVYIYKYIYVRSLVTKRLLLIFRIFTNSKDRKRGTITSLEPCFLSMYIHTHMYVCECVYIYMYTYIYIYI